METFGRLMAGIAPWLTLPDDDTEEGKIRKELREMALKSYANAVDPQSPDYLLWRQGGPDSGGWRLRGRKLSSCLRSVVETLG